MENFIYPARLTSEHQEGGFVVTFSDFPEAITQGKDTLSALSDASDCLEETIANRIVMNLPIPRPSRIGKQDHGVPLPVQMAAKAALYLAMSEAKISKVELAKRLHCDEKEVRRLLDPRHPSKLPRIELALAMVGRRLVLGFQVAV